MIVLYNHTSRIKKVLIGSRKNDGRGSGFSQRRERPILRDMTMSARAERREGLEAAMTMKQVQWEHSVVSVR